jgi:phosphomethylpyrimidine synthase
MTKIESAKKGIITNEMKKAAQEEKTTPEQIMHNIAFGKTVILKSASHRCRPVAIGKNCRIKINTNLGTSARSSSVDDELNKLNMAAHYGSDTVMDLGTIGDTNAIRKSMLESTMLPVGSVPLYELFTGETDVTKITESDMLNAIKQHIESGVDFITVHCGITQHCIPLLTKRILGIVSKGGNFLLRWMVINKKENPLYTHFNEIIAMAREHDVTLSLGDGLRPGCLADASDTAHIEEMITLGTLANIAHGRGVQVIVEGPGHISLDHIREMIALEKEYCNEAPYFVLGPLVCDVTPGYDHITGAIGGAFAAYYGADFLCSITPKEHLGVPSFDHIIEGVIAAKIAAHAADIARGFPGSREPDDDISRARSRKDWENIFSLSVNPDKARALRDKE